MDLTIMGVCGEDMDIYAKKKPNGQIRILIEDENGEEVFCETTTRRAWESLVYFSKQVIYQDSKMLEGAKDD